MRMTRNGAAKKLEEVVLFPFDDYAMPFQRGVRLQLHSYTRSVSASHNIVVGTGEKGAPDDLAVTGYATVRRVGEELWMWYCAQSTLDDEWHERVCLATSTDGRSWIRPKLGLVEFGGNKENNLVNLPVTEHVQACVVFHDPADPDPARRFKMSFESGKYRNKMAVAFSEDGLNWTLHPNNPVGPVFEQAGGAKYDGVYYLTGQGDGHWSPKGGSRKLQTLVSYDFYSWTPCSCVGLNRDPLPPLDTQYGHHAGPQVHLGAALWNRGNTLIGFYGMWNGHPSNDRRLTWMHLGLVVSDDGLHYREPIPDFPIVMAAEIGWKTLPEGDAVVHFPAVIQTQGFENIGDETLFWYSAWPEGDADGVRLASWPKDRLGHLEAFTGPESESYVISQPLSLDERPAEVYVNADRLGENSGLALSVLTEDLKPLPGFDRENSAVISKSGFRQPALWSGRKALVSDKPVRIRIDFTGIRPEDARLYAVYITH